jgi:hypothetical protein
MPVTVRSQQCNAEARLADAEAELLDLQDDLV